MVRLVSKQTGSPAKGADQVVTRGRWKLRIGAAAIVLASLLAGCLPIGARPNRSFVAREFMLRASDIGDGYKLRYESVMRSDGTGEDTVSVWDGDAGGIVEQKNYRLDSTIDAILDWEPILQMKGDFPVPGLDERSLHFQRLSHLANTDRWLGRDFQCEILGQRDEYLTRLFVSSYFSSPVSLADCARLIGIIDVRLDALLAKR